MARTALTPNDFSLSGDDIEAALAAFNVDGHKIVNNGRVVIVVKNTNVTSRTLTIQTPKTVDGLAVADPTITVAQNEIQIVGPFTPDTFNQSGADRGMFYIDIDTETDVTVAAYRLP